MTPRYPHLSPRVPRCLARQVRRTLPGGAWCPVLSPPLASCLAQVPRERTTVESSLTFQETFSLAAHSPPLALTSPSFLSSTMFLLYPCQIQPALSPQAPLSFPKPSTAHSPDPFRHRSWLQTVPLLRWTPFPTIPYLPRYPRPRFQCNSLSGS